MTLTIDDDDVFYLKHALEYIQRKMAAKATDTDLKPFRGSIETQIGRYARILKTIEGAE